MEKTVEIFCSRESFIVYHMANHLQNAEIEYIITGDTATTVFGIENPTQEVCIRVFQNDVIKAKKILEPYLQQ